MESFNILERNNSATKVANQQQINNSEDNFRLSCRIRCHLTEMITLYKLILNHYTLQDEDDLQKTQSAASLVNQVTEQVLSSREVVR